MMLNALAELDPPPPGTAGHVEALVAAKRFAFAARDRHVADPRFVDVPLAELLSPAFARDGAAGPDPGPVRSSAGDTVYLCAVDAEGNACSMIESIYYGFGSCFVAGDTGLLMHNRGHYFSLDDDHANRLEPGPVVVGEHAEHLGRGNRLGDARPGETPRAIRAATARRSSWTSRRSSRRPRRGRRSRPRRRRRARPGRDRPRPR